MLQMSLHTFVQTACLNCVPEARELPHVWHISLSLIAMLAANVVVAYSWGMQSEHNTCGYVWLLIPANRHRISSVSTVRQRKYMVSSNDCQPQRLDVTGGNSATQHCI